jgi:hypothetical protein
MNVLEIRNRILRPILLPMGFSAIGFAVAIFVFKRLLHFELDRLEISIIAFVVTTLSVLYLFQTGFCKLLGKDIRLHRQIPEN